MSNLEMIMAEKGTPSLKAIAMAVGVTPVRVYTVAKTAKEGEVYDPKVYNWDAIERFVTRRLTDDMPTLDDVVAAALEKDNELKSSDGRRRAHTGAVNRKIQANGKEYDARKYDYLEMTNNQYVVFKKEDVVYKIVYQTLTHTVLVPVNSDGSEASTELRVMSNFMLNLKAVVPADREQEINDRFNAMGDATEAE